MSHTKSSCFNKGIPEADLYSQEVILHLKQNGIDFAVGVPCGVQRDLIHLLQIDTDIIHVACTRESEAVGIAVGAFLSGRQPIVYMQNSGLFAASNDIASLAMLYNIPLLFSVTWRGAPGEDAPQHFITGNAMHSLLTSFNINFLEITKNNIASTIHTATQTLRNTRRPFALLFRRGWNK